MPSPFLAVSRLLSRLCLSPSHRPALALCRGLQAIGEANEGAGADGRFSPELFDEEGDEAAAGLQADGATREGAGGASGRYSPPLLQAHQVSL